MNATARAWDRRRAAACRLASRAAMLALCAAGPAPAPTAADLFTALSRTQANSADEHVRAARALIEPGADAQALAAARVQLDAAMSAQAEQTRPAPLVLDALADRIDGAVARLDRAGENRMLPAFGVAWPALAALALALLLAPIGGAVWAGRRFLALGRTQAERFAAMLDAARAETSHLANEGGEIASRLIRVQAELSDAVEAARRTQAAGSAEHGRQLAQLASQADQVERIARGLPAILGEALGAAEAHGLSVLEAEALRLSAAARDAIEQVAATQPPAPPAVETVASERLAALEAAVARLAEGLARQDEADTLGEITAMAARAFHTLGSEAAERLVSAAEQALAPLPEQVAAASAMLTEGAREWARVIADGAENLQRAGGQLAGTASAVADESRRLGEARQALTAAAAAGIAEIVPLTGRLEHAADAAERAASRADAALLALPAEAARIGVALESILGAGAALASHAQALAAVPAPATPGADGIAAAIEQVRATCLELVTAASQAPLAPRPDPVILEAVNALGARLDGVLAEVADSRTTSDPAALAAALAATQADAVAQAVRALPSAEAFGRLARDLDTMGRASADLLRQGERQDRAIEHLAEALSAAVAPASAAPPALGKRLRGVAAQAMEAAAAAEDIATAATRAGAWPLSEQPQTGVVLAEIGEALAALRRAATAYALAADGGRAAA